MYCNKQIPDDEEAAKYIKPPGWPKKNKLIGSQYEFARCHLIARQLGGAGKRDAGRDNLVTCYQKPVNNEYMKEIENDIRAAVEDGQNIGYTVIPEYDSDQSDKPDRIRMIAISGENDGLHVNACFLNQPVVQTNYGQNC
ncbi:hypothetical protein Aple_025380 [Acrocarpospora pleiomorpha]|uniref:Type VII secretion system protein EssD-like domain-containing protein n=2 Tax=Acrocarpospora pleiomorpha TaxID=90975 RepID=A0A5M3XFY3_9ACTN|nr:hypothetical protein Aple_025380 [Acrocarpospora pleiomorpha]